MDTAIKLLFYLAAGAFLLGTNLWLVRTFLDSFGPPSAVAPFQVIGKEAADERLGAALAHMLVARFGTIKQELDLLQRGLKADDDRPRQVVHSVARTRDAAGGASSVEVVLDITNSPSWPSDVFQPLDLELTVGGVALGGVLAWVHRSLAEPRMIRISVEYNDDSSSATVFGNVETAGGKTLYLENIKAINEEIVTNTAYAIAQHHVGQGIPEVEALEPAEFRTLLAALRQTAEINRRAALGREIGDGYAKILKDVRALADVMDEWPLLIRFAADLAYTTKEYSTALAYYLQVRDLTADSGEDRTQVLARIKELEPVVATLQQAAARPVEAAAAKGADPVDELVKSPLAARVLELVGVTTREMPAEPIIAVIGGVPPEGTVDPARMKVIGGNGASSDPAMSDYIGTVVQTVRLIAPDARFLFSPASIENISALVPVIEAMMAEPEKPAILLVTFGPLAGPEFETVFGKAADEGIAVVLAAGNRPDEPIPLAGTQILSRLLVAAAVAQDGQPSDFTSKGDPVLWAPGANIPVLTRDGRQMRLEPRSGTTYSAAVVAGTVARVLAEHPSLDLGRLLEVLRSTSTPAVAGGPPVLNLQKALAALQPSD